MGAICHSSSSGELCTVFADLVSPGREDIKEYPGILGTDVLGETSIREH